MESITLSEKTQECLATMAIENMYPDEEFLNMLAAIDNGELTFEDVRKELNREYARF